jgi:hypothetical protein
VVYRVCMVQGGGVRCKVGCGAGPGRAGYVWCKAGHEVQGGVWCRTRQRRVCMVQGGA